MSSVAGQQAIGAVRMQTVARLTPRQLEIGRALQRAVERAKPEPEQSMNRKKDLPVMLSVDEATRRAEFDRWYCAQNQQNGLEALF